MKKTKDYLALWQVDFTMQYGSSVWSTRRVSAWTVEEAIAKATKVERNESAGKMQITSVKRLNVIDA